MRMAQPQGVPVLLRPLWVPVPAQPYEQCGATRAPPAAPRLLSLRPSQSRCLGPWMRLTQAGGAGGAGCVPRLGGVDAISTGRGMCSAIRVGRPSPRRQHRAEQCGCVGECSALRGAGGLGDGQGATGPLLCGLGGARAPVHFQTCPPLAVSNAEELCSGKMSAEAVLGDSGVEVGLNP